MSNRYWFEAQTRIASLAHKGEPCLRWSGNIGKSIVSAFSKKYSCGTEEPYFAAKSVDEIEPDEEILLDEALNLQLIGLDNENIPASHDLGIGGKRPGKYALFHFAGRDYQD